MHENRPSLIGAADPNDPNNELMVRLQAALAEHENALRQRRMMAATRAKVRHGHAVRVPPTGFVADRDGRWELDPDQAVRETITRLFADFERLGTVGRVARHYHATGVCLPVRHRAIVRWVPPVRRRIYAILTHPAFKGDYVFGRRVNTPTEVIVVPNHHAGYVTPKRWARIQAQLRRNRRAGK